MYAGLVEDPGSADALAKGSIDGYIQVAGDVDAVVAGLRAVVDGLRGWPDVHLVLRLLFPEPDLDLLLTRLAVVGERVLPLLRKE